MVADLDARDLLRLAVGDHGHGVVAAERHEAVAAAAAVRRPVGLRALRRDLVGEGGAVHDRRVVRHRPGGAQLLPRGVHREPVVGGIEQVVLAPLLLRLVAQRQVGQAQHAVLLEVVLHEAVEERDLEVQVALVGRQRHRPHRPAHVRLAELVELLAHVDLAEHGPVARVDDLEDALALGLVEGRIVERRENGADARVVDELPVLREVVLVRLVAARDARHDRAGLRVDHVDDLGRRGRDEHVLAVGRDRHVVGSVAVDLRAPDDLLRAQVDRDDVGEARPRHVQHAPVVRREHVVHELVVALADLLADREEVAEPLRVRLDLRHPLVDVRDDVDAREPPEPARLDDVGGAVPVVADVEDVARLRRLLARRAGGRRGHGGDGEQRIKRDGTPQHRRLFHTPRDHFPNRPAA